MVVFDSFYSLKLLILTNYAKISHFQPFSIHFIEGMAQNYILPTPNMFHPSEKAELCRGTFFYSQDDILKFLRWPYIFKIKVT